VTYRSDLDALDARHAALTTELGTKTRELEDATRLLDEARARAKLPILDNIRVASPCTASWDEMTGDERTRHCHKCDKQVYNLSDMTRAEAEALLLEKQGKLCARYYRRSDGTIMTADCRVGVVASRKRKLIASGAMALLGTATGIAIQRHNRIELAATDEVEVAPSTEAVTTHVAAKVQSEAPPPRPIEHHEVVVETKGEVLMGDVSASFEER
jgi:hypothetical protein